MAQAPGENGKTIEQLPIMTKNLQDCFKFGHPKGMVNAKSKMKVNITFKPTISFDFNIQLVVVAKKKIAKETLNVTQGNPQLQPRTQDLIKEKCAISCRAKGDFPLIRITDIRND